MNVLSLEKQSAIIAALCEGVSIRSTARLHDVHKNTVMTLGRKVGEGCTAVHGKLMVEPTGCSHRTGRSVELRQKERRNVQEEDPDTVGDQFIYLAMDSTGKAILSWYVGKRNFRSTMNFVEDLRYRVVGAPDFSTDGYQPYQRAIDLVFDTSSHGVVDKQVVVIAASPDSPKYYARETLVKVERFPMKGTPDHISTSFIERQNLTLRMTQRRLTRLSNGFSKKYENHCAAVALYAMHYNFCRVHETLRITPAMQIGVTDHIWSISELVNAALNGEIQARVAWEKSRFPGDPGWTQLGFCPLAESGQKGKAESRQRPGLSTRRRGARCDHKS
ncbi:MAG: IS1 family transposase [Rhizomicrobium sp.]